MKIIFIILLTQFITSLNANETIKTIKELSKTVYNFNNQEYTINKEKLDKLIVLML